MACRRNSAAEIALRACLIAGAILIGTALIGDWLLRNLGITLPAFRIAGGLLLFAVASEMVLGLRLKHAAQDAEQAAEEHLHNMAAFPLAIPMMAGPQAPSRRPSCSPARPCPPGMDRDAAVRGRRAVIAACFVIFMARASGSARPWASPATWCCRGCSA